MMIFLIVHLSASISDSRYSYIMQTDNRHYMVVFEELKLKLASVQ